MKRIFVNIGLGAAAAWILAIPTAAQGHGAGTNHAGGGAGSMSSAHNTDTPGNATSSGPRTMNEVLTHNTQLSSKLSSLLPAGTDLQTAAIGFKNLGQFVAAVHVSHNLDIPFDQLKCTELATAAACPKGLTVPVKGSSLGGAIQTLKPSLSSTESKTAAKQAEKQASTEISGTVS